MAQIEFKNLETQTYFQNIITEFEQKERAYQNKLKRILTLQKSGLCSSPVKYEEEF